MEQIPEGYCVPTEFTVWNASLGDQPVLVLDMAVVVPGHDMEPQRAVLVLLPEDAGKIASDINKAVTAGEEQ